MKWTNYVTAALATALLTTASYAQDKPEKPAKEEQSEEIVIRKKGGNTEKMIIVVDGNNVTINGKPVDEYKSGNVTVLKRKRSMANAAPRVRRLENGPGGGLQSFDRMMPASANKALLGVAADKGDGGAVVKEVSDDSPAEKAGLQKGDVITKVGSAEIKDAKDLIEAIGERKPDDKVEITYKRNGKENKATATLGENKSQPFAYDFKRNFNFDFPGGSMPGMENFKFDFNRRPKIGIEIQDLEEGKGVKVKNVDDNSPAAKAGLKEGDIITGLNGKDVAAVGDLRDSVKNIKEGESLKLTYKRGGKSETAEVKIPKRLETADL